MKRLAIFASLGLLCAQPCLAQTDSQTLQAILAEVRAIHNEVRISESSQLLLAELQIQQTVVNRALQRRDELRSKVAETQASEKEVTEKLARAQGGPDPGMTPAEKSDFADFRQELEHSLDGLKIQEAERSNNLQEAESSLRREQASVENIQAEFNDVFKKLKPVNSQ